MERKADLVFSLVKAHESWLYHKWIATSEYFPRKKNRKEGLQAVRWYLSRHWKGSQDWLVRGGGVERLVKTKTNTS